MKTKYLTVWIVLLTIAICSHAQSYEAAFKGDMCSCLSEELGKEKRSVDENLDYCFKKHLVDYASQIDMQTEGTYYERQKQGREIRADLFIRFRQSLVHSCDPYYEALKNSREEQYLVLRRGADPNKLEQLSQNVALNPSYYNYLNRGKLYFALGNFKEAISDFLRAKEPLTIPGEVNIWLGWAYEKNGNLKEALDVYCENEKWVRLSDIPIKREMVRRQLGGGALKITVQGKNDTLPSKGKDLLKLFDH